MGYVIIDLDKFVLHLSSPEKNVDLELDFYGTKRRQSRRFHLSVIALVINEMMKSYSYNPIQLTKYSKQLTVLDSLSLDLKSINIEGVYEKIFKAWCYRLPNLEEAVLFKISRRKKYYDESGKKLYKCSNEECDNWANLISVRGDANDPFLKFSIDKIGLDFEDVSIRFSRMEGQKAWNHFLNSFFNFKYDKEQKRSPTKNNKIEAYHLEEAPKQSIFTEDFRKFIRFESRTEYLDDFLLRMPKGFNVQDTEKFKNYVVRKEYHYESIIRGNLKKGKSVLIKGPPKVGKTRLVFEVLKNIENYYVFSLFQNYWPKIHKLNFTKFLTNENVKILWFIDDIHYFSEKIQMMYEKLVSFFEEVVVIATLRSDKTMPDVSLTKSMTNIDISVWSEFDLKKLSKKNSIPLKHQIGNTPLSIIKDFSDLKAIYNFYKIEKNKKYQIHILHYLKLLYDFLQIIEYNLLERVVCYLRKDLSDSDDFRIALLDLENSGFIKKEGKYILSWDIFFTEVITDKDYHTIDDMKRLVTFFTSTKKFDKLNDIGLYAMLNDYDDLIFDIENNILKIDPKNSSALNNRGNQYLKKGNINLAIKDFTEAIIIDAECDIAYENRGRAYFKKDLIHLAINDFTAAIKIRPENFHAYYWRGISYWKKGEIDLAINDFTEVIRIVTKLFIYINNENQIDPNLSLIYYYRGYVYCEKGEINLAVNDFTEAIRLNQNNNKAHYNRSRTYALLRNKSKMLSDLKEAISLDPHYKMKAKGDKDFNQYWNDADFIKIVNT